ncbi:PilW family protein [Ramlibacter sp. MAHUQ-53]|uniref:PilW family protein n=1 Tax=unclassified Ramlibacter TaxID=2617605 RepID=UPI003645D220
MLRRTQQRGLSLVELLVGVAIALVLIAGASLVYVNSLRATTTSNAMSRVNQDLRAIMSVIENDLHRAGFWGRAAAGMTNNPFMVRSSAAGVNNTDLHISADYRCVLYTFDLDVDGVVDEQEFFGFWFDSTNRRLMVLNQAGTSKVSNTAAITKCEDYSWLPMNYPGTVNLQDVTFQTGGSQCIAFAPDTFDPAGTPGVTYTRWYLTPEDLSLKPPTTPTNHHAACDLNAGAPAGTPKLPASALVPGSPTVPAGQTGRAEVRVVIVTLRAAHAKDSGSTRTLETAVRLRNDRMQ